MTRLTLIILPLVLLAGCAVQDIDAKTGKPIGVPHSRLDPSPATSPDGNPVTQKRSSEVDVPVAEDAISRYVPEPWKGLALAGLGLIAAYQKFRRSKSEKAVEQTVAAVESAGKTPELKTALAVHQDADVKAHVAKVKAKLPKVVKATPAVAGVVEK